MAQLLVLVFVLVFLTFASYLQVTETDLMKQAFAAIAGFVTGGIGGYIKGKMDGKPEDPTIK